MKSGAVDMDRLKADGRQSGHRRKGSKNKPPILNGVDESLLSENESVVRQVNMNLVAAYQDHISCTESSDLCKIDNGGHQDASMILPCESDHIYATCDDIKSKTLNINVGSPSNNITKDLALENMNLRDVILSHLNLIHHLQEDLEAKKKNIADLQKERDKLKLRLEQSKREHRIRSLSRRCVKNDTREPLLGSAEQKVVRQLNTRSSSTEDRHSASMPVLATRYFGRRSRTVPSRALKRRYMGPPKTPAPKQAVSKNKYSANHLSSASVPAIHIKKEFPESPAPTGSEEAPRIPKKRGRKPKAKKNNILTTDMAYTVSDFTTATPTSPPAIHVPSWKKEPVRSFYQMEGTENINDSVFDRRHLKYEQDERRRKRWDMQRLREQKASEKVRRKQGREREGASQSNMQSLHPDLRQVHYIEVVDELPVIAFGQHIPPFKAR